MNQKVRYEKFGIPHAVHCQDILDDANALYMYVDMWRHSTWYHLLQSSHATPLSFHVTALVHTWHGYLGVLGPGLDSISDEIVSINRARYMRVCWVRSFTNWIHFKFLCLIMSLILSSKGSNDLLSCNTCTGDVF